ncbi:MAG: hypothetical protein IKZ51_06730 [Bacteroidales bacterium]|nr:hypothetical protein [Bacteroidales bacterium]
MQRIKILVDYSFFSLEEGGNNASLNTQAQKIHEVASLLHTPNTVVVFEDGVECNTKDDIVEAIKQHKKSHK